MPRKNSKPITDRNPRGAGAPAQYRDRVQIAFSVEGEVKQQFQRLAAGKRGALAAHLNAALTDYLKREDIAAKLTGASGKGVEHG